ncbi:MAG TPA: XRE family transcriptional regulator [Actinomycetota bacterium]
MFGPGNEVRERVKRLRLVRGWDQTKLGELADIPQPKISQIELGKLLPSDEQISGLAKAFGYSPDFLTAELRLMPTTRPWLRANADASKREADQRTAATTLAAEYVRCLGLKPLPDLIPEFHGSLADDDAIEELAGEARENAQIEQGEVVGNAIRAAERLGCVVLPLESELGKHWGMSVRADELPIVNVAKSSAVPGDRQRWTVAHELGHLALHGNSPPPRDADEARRMEQQAHRFAAGFLIPADALIEMIDGRDVTLGVLAEVKSTWGVAIKALVHRCQSLGIIEPDHARSLYKQISSRKWTKKEPLRVPNESAQWFERTLTRKAQADDLPTACKRLASEVGGNAVDLLSFADWSEGPDAEVVSLAGRRRN